MTPKSIFSVLLLIGLGFSFYALTLPYYTDQAAKEKLDTDMAEKLDAEKFKNIEENYYADVDKLKTLKTTYLDFGAGLVIASLTILIFLFAKKIQRFSDLIRITSIDKFKLVVLANLVWLLQIPGTHLYYWFRALRGDYPWFADSFGIPIMIQTPIFLWGLIPLNIFILLSFIKSNHPTNLFIRPDHYNTKEIFKEIFWAFCLLINLFFLVIFVFDGDHISIPVNLFFTFVLLNLRAGQINRSTPIEQQTTGETIA